MKRHLNSTNKTYFLLHAPILVVTLVFMRGYGMLYPSARPLLPLSFVIMTIVPLLLLFKEGREKIGLQRTTSAGIYLFASLLGALYAFLCYILGILLFNETPDNWFVTIQSFYLGNPAFNESLPLWQTFLIFTIPAIIFSPAGEEIFFRGFLQEVLKLNFNNKLSTLIECMIFGLIHVFHHGVNKYQGSITFLPISAFIWIMLMTGMAYLLLQVRNYSTSIYPAIVCHASFNLTMNWIIFYVM